MKVFTKYTFLVVLAVGLNACFGDLDTIPTDPDVTTAAQVYENTEAYQQVLAKLYAGLAVSGQEGPAGKSDIEGIDEGFGQYLRGLWYHQEFSTDEAVVGWNDQTIKDFHNQSWTSSDAFIFAFYSRIFYQIPLCNEFLRESTAEKLEARGHGSVSNEVEGYRAEARFLRALSYWHALDNFRNVPFVTEDDAVGQFFPEQLQGVDLFNYIESELLDIESSIASARSSEYGRADQGAVWALLAKLYLNAEVYTGTPRWQDCLQQCDKLIGAGYTLDDNYQHLFLADNHLSNEIIFPITYDGVRTRTWGGTTFLVSAAIGGSMDPFDSGVSGGWGGVRTTRQLVEKFGEIGGIFIEPSEGNTSTYGQIYATGSYQDTEAIDIMSSITSPNNDNVYEGYKYFPNDNEGFVVRSIPALNGPFLGDNDGDGELDSFGAEITSGSSGLYYIQVDLNTNQYIFEKVDWKISGSGVNEASLEWVPELGAMQVTAVVSDSELLFESNGRTLGDSDGDAVLEYGGDPISVPAGEWAFTLYINRPDYTFKIQSASFDTRPFFYSDGQTLDIIDISQFTNGYAVNKYKNITREGNPGSDNVHPDIDFPVFRLGDIYLMAAESVLRQSGDKSAAASYFNVVRERAYGGAGGRINPDALDLNMILDERARELYWEGHRRTDLVRFGQFTDGDYLWQWKGGVFEGVQVESYRDIYPIPSSDVASNPNLDQNDGY